MPTPRYLLIGGSNCVIRGGVGAELQEKLPGRWTNRSLGNSPSLRGAEYLLGNIDALEEFDQIFFEYTLNDLIFELSQTLDPQTHLAWLRTMLSVEPLRSKLIFVLLHGQGASRRIGADNSFVLDHYRQVIREFSVRSIDLLPLIADRVAQDGAENVFKDNDHFSDAMVGRLVASAVEQFSRLPRKAPPAPGRHESVYHLETIDPLSGQRIGVQARNFKTSLIAMQLANLEKDSELIISSPGGTLIGLYGLASREAGCIAISTDTYQCIKSFRHQFRVEKPYLAMRQLTVPIHTRPNEQIRIRFARNAHALPGAVLDNTMAQVINHDGTSVQIGSLIFMLAHAAPITLRPPSGFGAKLRNLFRFAA